MDKAQHPPPGTRPITLWFDVSRTQPSSESTAVPMPDNDARDNESGSDSDTDSSSQSSESSYDPATALVSETDAPRSAPSKKRQSETPDFSTDQSNKKRVKIDLDTHRGIESGPLVPRDRSKQLPAEIWHHIFTFLPPRSLGNSLRVNKLFYNYLDPSPLVKVPCPSFSEPPSWQSRKRLSICKPDSIWQSSRRLFWPRMPSPLKGRSEVDMWRLACSQFCQFCNIKDGAGGEITRAKDQWHRGPGAKGVSPIFPFFVVSCGSCLADRILKEIDVLLSSTTPSALLAGLPAGFLTSEMHVIAPQTIQGESSSIQGQLSKVYWKGQIENIKTEFDEVKGLGLAAAEEWLKGLEARGKQVRADASRWEKWDISGGVRQMRLTDTQAQAGSAPSPPNWRGQGQRTTQTEMEAERKPLSEATSEPDKPTPETKYVPVRSQARLQGNKKRTKEEVVELKRERKAEIERRAGLLDPPLTPAVLAHIPTFQAALQLIAPLDEDAWEILRPRLLAQRAKAEKRERESLVSAMGPKGTSGQGESATSRRDPRQVPDAEWDEIQGPVRARISSYADEIITDGWNGGDKVGKKNCPQFAAEVLVYVRKRFYAEVAKDTAAAAAAGKELVVDPAEGPWTQKLTVENMKWVFDVKIKPHTDKHRKELFQCNGCQGNSKYYGLEGVIQHYAAKHTDALSLGNVVVYWRAEWPATPPFNPDPNSKHATQQQPADRRAQPAPPSTTQPPFSATSSGNDPSPATHQAAQFAGNAPYGHAAPAPHPPPAIYGPGTAPPAPYSLSYTQQPYSPQALYPPYTTGSTYSSSHPPPAPTPGAFSSHRPSSSHSPYPDAGGSIVPMAAFDNEYKTRLDFMARVARQTWNRISHVDGLPGAVRLCVTIHHIAKGFEMHFSDSAPLEMFMYGLSNHKEMRPIRSINGLKCKPCVEGMAAQDKSLSVPQLVKHFHKTHVEVEARPLDWRIQMILLPELHVLEGLPTVLAYNRAAYDTVADALPWAFRENREIAQPHPGNRPYDRFPIPNAPSYQLQGSYNPSYVAVQRHGGRGYAAHQPAAASLPEQPPERLPYYAGNPDSGRPNLRPAHQVYGRAEPPRVPVKREFNDSERHTGSESGRPDKAPRVVLEERSRDVPGLPATKPLPSMDDMRGQRDYPLSSYAYNGHLENRDPTTERWEGNRHNMDPRASATSAAENGFKLLDALESHLDGSQARPGQVPASRPAEYHPADPARYATAPEWSRPRRPSPPPYAPQQNDYYQDRRPTERHYPPSQTAPEYRYRDDPPPRPAEEYELLEVRDPQHGTYYIRRPSRREFYAYHVRDEDRTHEYPQFNGGGRSGTVAPASTADLEEYDPRFPAGDMPPQPSRYP